MGTSTRPVLTTRPARANTLVPLLVSVPMPAYQSPPLRMIGAMLAKVSTLLISVGLPPQPGDGRVRRAGPGRAPPALDRGDQGRLLAAHERPGAQPQLDLELEGGVGDAGAEQPGPAGQPDGRLEPGDGQRVLGPAVDVAAAGPDGVAGDGHALQHPVGVALQDAAVHERPRVALVGVADHVLLRAGGLGHRRPFQAGRVAGPAPAAQAAADDLVDHLGRGQLGAAPSPAPGSRRGRGSRPGPRGRPGPSSRSPPGPAGRRTAPAAPGWHRAGRPGALRRGRRGRPGRPARTAGRSREPRPGGRRRTGPGSRPA